MFISIGGIITIVMTTLVAFFLFYRCLQRKTQIAIKKQEKTIINQINEVLEVVPMSISFPKIKREINCNGAATITISHREIGASIFSQTQQSLPAKPQL